MAVTNGPKASASSCPAGFSSRIAAPFRGRDSHALRARLELPHDFHPAHSATGIYTIAGGLKAVIYTDLFQSFVLRTGAIVLMLIGLDRVGGFASLRAALPPDFFHMIKPARNP